MLFTLTALTPLLVGQYQYKAKEVKNTVHENGGTRLPFFNQSVSEDKAILEPIRLTDGRVVLSGTSLKGMVRNSLSGLLSPPMERVAERSYSYRPNAQYQRNEDFRCVRPAIITAVHSQKIEVRVLNNATAVYFVRGNAEQNFKDVPIHERVVRVQDVTLDNAGVRRHIVASKNASIGAGYYIRYDGGIDGTGELHHGIRGGFTYHHVWIEEREYNAGKTDTLPVDIISHYEKTLAHFLSDDGLFASGYPNNEGKAKTHIKAIQQRWQSNRAELVGRLIYVELENGQITSFGHHYYYRWRYANTIRTLWQSANKSAVRAILAPLKSETTIDEKGKPSALTAARLLFGYTSHPEQDPLKQDGMANIGTGHYQRLAGRIHINSAVEVVTDGKNNERFLNNGQTIAMKPLGQPRPSSVEHYLQQPSNVESLQSNRQDGGQMFTYGDLPNRNKSSPLAGRKFYLHQPDAARYENCYQSTDESIIQSQQAMLARFVSKPETQFKFKLQFKDLRPWELGALLVTLEPTQHLATVLEQLKNDLPQHEQTLQALLNEINKHPNSAHKNLPLFAHKLGHARPLGFGSVLLKCDELKLLGIENDLPKIKKDDSETDNALSAFANKLTEIIKESKSVEVLKQWCAIHQYAGRTRATYRQLNGDIFKFHSTARNEHIAARRLALTQAKLSDKILKPLKFEIPQDK